MASVRTIGLSSPWLDEREEELVADVLRSVEVETAGEHRQTCPHQLLRG